MDKSSKRSTKNQETQEDKSSSQKISTVGRPRCLEVAKRGVRTGGDFAELMSGLMTDVIEGRVTPSIANATCNAGGKLLKVVEMQIKYATTAGGDNQKSLNLLDPGK